VESPKIATLEIPKFSETSANIYWLGCQAYAQAGRPGFCEWLSRSQGHSTAEKSNENME
jgi:hypothetical protein